MSVRATYLTLMLLSTLAASFIWGVNTLFLLSAGLSNAQAFAANAFFTVGQVIFEVPTGIVADVWGRRTSYLLGTLTLALTTMAYYYAWTIAAPFWIWAVISVLLGLGFTFFSGATEAWLVDALAFTKFKGSLEAVFGQGQAISGAAMLIGSVAGGVIAQFGGLGLPYIFRSLALLLTFSVAWFYMKDLGFTPLKGVKAIDNIRRTFKDSLEHGLKNPPVRWMMLSGPFGAGVSFYAFYALQPHLLKLYGDPTAYSIAGLAAAIVAGSQIVGGLSASKVRKYFKLRTSILITAAILGTLALGLTAATTSFYLTILLLVVWGLTFSLMSPIRQAYLNGLIPTNQRATVLSFDSLMGSSGGVVIQPALGKVADGSGYGASFAVGAGFQLLALPFMLLARREKTKSDIIS